MVHLIRTSDLSSSLGPGINYNVNALVTTIYRTVGEKEESGGQR